MDRGNSSRNRRRSRRNHGTGMHSQTLPQSKRHQNRHNQAKDKYTVSDVKLIPSSWSEKEYPATSVEVTVKKGVATVTLTFPHVTQFSNPQVTLRINGKKSKFKVCQ